MRDRANRLFSFRVSVQMLQSHQWDLVKAPSMHCFCIGGTKG
jgi:hypothetical protein